MKFNRKSLTVLTPSTTALISTSDMKNYMRIDTSADDALIADLISAATEGAKQYLRRSLITETLVLSMDGFSEKSRDEIDILGAGVHDASKIHILGYSNEFNLPKPPIQSITSIKTYGTDNTESTFDSSKYQLDESGGRIYLNQGESWPTNLRDREAVKITFVVGYGDNPSDVPSPIVQAVKMWVAKMYESRGGCECPESCKMLLNQYKLYDNLGFC